ncbi:SLAM family member 5-like [Xenopus laevis]|uniref:Ig-like domain-containing protein n=2 Tax=Xenopus laevis TaxID=8355 RepID=A0A974C9R8_XENLA|nr:SLAM family member 5-like [Xenopus laevis]OCT69157.1 hypothetical protein XELAEV_18040466mg [Xenopus laevis]
MQLNLPERLQFFFLLCLVQFASGGQDDLIQVHGLLNHSITLSYHRLLERPVKMTIWEIKRRGKTFAVAEYNGGQLEIQNEKFENRIQASNGTELKIHSLRMEDTDIYKADIILTDLHINTAYFNLTVHEPVSVPSITADLKGDNKGRCEFTLHCSVPSNASLTLFSWIYRCGNSGYQHYANGSTLTIMLQNLSETTEFLCLAQNPVDVKNASFYSEQICNSVKSPPYSTCWIKVSIAIPVVAVLCLVVILFIKIAKK